MIFVPQTFSSRVVRLVLMRLVGVKEDSSPLIKHLLSLTPGALSFSIFLEQLFLPAAGGSVSVLNHAIQVGTEEVCAASGP